MNLSREFTREIAGKEVNFHVTYNPVTHTFGVVENGAPAYELSFNMNNREWKTAGNHNSSVSVEQLAVWVQESFGIFV